MRPITPTEAVQLLAAAGWSEARIARAAETSQPTVHRIKHGQVTVSFDLGIRLLHLAETIKPGVVPPVTESAHG